MTLSAYVICGCVWGIFLVAMRGVGVLVNRALLHRGMIKELPATTFKTQLFAALLITLSTAVWPLGVPYWLATCIAGFVVSNHARRGIFTAWTQRAWTLCVWPDKIPHPGVAPTLALNMTHATHFPCPLCGEAIHLDPTTPVGEVVHQCDPTRGEG